MSSDPETPPISGIPWAMILIVAALLLMVGGIVVALSLPVPLTDK